MAKIELSTSEIQFMRQPEIILTKNKIIQAVFELMGDLSKHAEERLKTVLLPKEIMHTIPKIYKGENYEQLPWVMLDYPRCFNHEDVFAIRIFFLWGNFISITLQIKGNYKTQFADKVIAFAATKNARDYFLCCNTDEWQHHFRADNYLPLPSFSADEIKGMPFIKLSKKMELNDWKHAEAFLRNGFDEIVDRIIKSS